MVCPYCNQGEIFKAELKNNNRVILICDECDSVWTDIENISTDSGISFDAFSKACQINPLWTEFEEVIKL